MTKQRKNFKGHCRCCGNFRVNGAKGRHARFDLMRLLGRKRRLMGVTQDGNAY